MTVWNLIIILCLAILYLAVVVVFLQIRRLREEIYANVFATPISRETVPPLFESHDRTDEILSEIRDLGELKNLRDLYQLNELKELKSLSSLEGRILAACATIPEQMRPEFEKILEEIQSLSMGSGPAVGTAQLPITATQKKRTGDGDAYDAARLLLSHGVDEEQVMAETGLSSEEVNLLKLRLSLLQVPKDLPKPDTL